MGLWTLVWTILAARFSTETSGSGTSGCAGKNRFSWFGVSLFPRRRIFRPFLPIVETYMLSGVHFQVFPSQRRQLRIKWFCFHKERNMKHTKTLKKIPSLHVGENLAHFWVRCLIFVAIYFLFFWVPSIAHLEPQLESFEVDDIGDDGDDDLS